MAGDEVKPADAAGGDAADGDAAATDLQPAGLPVDVLADVLGRVAPRWLAASRCVCRAWRDAIDGRGLLRADLLPLSLAGLFIHFDEHKFPEFLARPSSRAAAVSGSLSFLPSTSPHCGHIWDDGCDDWRDYYIRDHCNGLLLLSNHCVVNPATRWWNAVPTCPSERGTGSVSYREHLVYDPVLSPYYEVFMIPTLGSSRPGDEVDPSEWAPSLCKMHVFSSKSGCWEEKNFAREGGAAGICGEMQVSFGRFNGVYFRGALYVHYRANFVMRISLSNNTYSVLKPPVDMEEDTREDYYPYVQIVRSKRGLYFVELDKGWHQLKCWLRVWILNESCGQMKWVLKHDKDLKPVLAPQRFYQRVQWVLEDINYNMFISSSSTEDDKKTTTEERLEWNSDNDEEEDIVDNCYLENKKKAIVENKLEWSSSNHNALNNGDMVEECYLDEAHYDHIYPEDIEILGFHPYKEIAFLSASVRTGLAYHLNGSKIEKLGNIYPKDYVHFKALVNERERIKSFPYTPCWMEEFHGNN